MVIIVISIIGFLLLYSVCRGFFCPSNKRNRNRNQENVTAIGNGITSTNYTNPYNSYAQRTAYNQSEDSNYNNNRRTNANNSGMVFNEYSANQPAVRQISEDLPPPYPGFPEKSYF